MKCQILFSGKNKENIINMSSADFAERVVNVTKIISTMTRVLWNYAKPIKCHMVFYNLVRVFAVSKDII